MKTYILGSGLVAFLAHYLRPDWDIIPVGKSRYYKLQIPPCDDYILYHKDIEEPLKKLGSKTPIYFKRAFSYNGQIIYNLNSPFITEWKTKAKYKRNLPDINFSFDITGQQILSKIEQQCLQSFTDFLQREEKIKNIDTTQKIINTTHRQLDYDQIISTVPLNYLYDLCGIRHELKSTDLYSYFIETDQLDFEGATELLVVDELIPFYKCTALGKNIYRFMSLEEINDPNPLFKLFIKRFNLIGFIKLNRAIPDGGDIQTINDIKPIGDSAKWMAHGNIFEDMLDILHVN